jgi:hypothetical protein
MLCSRSDINQHDIIHDRLLGLPLLSDGDGALYHGDHFFRIALRIRSDRLLGEPHCVIVSVQSHIAYIVLLTCIACILCKLRPWLHETPKDVDESPARSAVGKEDEKDRVVDST